MKLRIALAVLLSLLTFTLAFPANDSASQINEAPVVDVIPSNGSSDKVAVAVYLDQLSNFYNLLLQRDLYTVVIQQEQAAQAAAAARAAETVPASWEATAICEEGGRNDPYAGYFGILEWNGFEGYPTAGSAPLDVQLAWEAAQGISPPDAPGQCHSY